MQVKSNQFTRLVIVGDGPDRERLEQFATGLDVDFYGEFKRASIVGSLRKC